MMKYIFQLLFKIWKVLWQSRNLECWGFLEKVKCWWFTALGNIRLCFLEVYMVSYSLLNPNLGPLYVNSQ